MKSHRIPMRLRASVVAVHGALLVLAGQAFAAEPNLVDLVQPKSTVEVGVANQSEFSAKANEFTGIKRKEPFLFGHVDLRGGGAWDSTDASRWRIEGTDLGTKSGSLEAEYGVQGRYRVRFGYDELRRNQSDSYQTPYLGIGTNTLLLPSNWMAVVGRSACWPRVWRIFSTRAMVRGRRSPAK